MTVTAGLAQQEGRQARDRGSEAAAISSGAEASRRQPFLFLSIQQAGSENLWCAWPVLGTQGDTKKMGAWLLGRGYLVSVTVSPTIQQSSILCRIRRLS